MLNKTKGLILIIFGSLGIAALVYIFANAPWKPQEPENKNTDHPPSTADQVKVMLLGKSTVNFPAVQSETAALAGPSDLLIFVPQGVVPVVLEVIYSEGKRGYSLSFEIDKSLIETNLNFAKIFQSNPTWQVLEGRRANLYAFLEAKGPQYTMRINETFVSDLRTAVIIEAVEEQP